MGKIRLNITTAALLVITCAGGAEGNAGIPGPLILAFGSILDSRSLVQWLAASMFMCVGIEAAIYRYYSLFAAPLRNSFTANVISLIAGIPLAFLGAVDPTGFVMPTVISIYVEWLYLRFRLRDAVPKRKAFIVVIGANVLTNIILYLYILKAVLH